jgi:hypothetical protein
VRAHLAPWTADQVILSAATTDRDPARAFGSAGWERLQRVLDAYDPERRIVGGALGRLSGPAASGPMRSPRSARRRSTS